MKYIRIIVGVWLSAFIDAWKKNDLDPVPFGEGVTLPSIEPTLREARPRNDTMPSHQWPQHPGVHKAVSNKDWN